MRINKIVLTDRQKSLPKASIKNSLVVDTARLSSFSNQAESGAVVQLMNKIPNSLIRGKPVKEWFRYEDASLWWLIHPRIWPKIEELIRFVDELENMFNEFEPSSVILDGYSDKIDIIKQICKKRRIRLSMGSFTRPKIFYIYQRQALRRRRLISRTNRIMKIRGQRRRSMNHNLSAVDRLGPGPVIYVAPQSYRVITYDIKNDEVSRNEHLLFKILSIVRSSKQLLCIDVDPPEDGGLSVLSERIKDRDKVWIPLEALVTPELGHKCMEMSRVILKRIRKLYGEPEFRKSIMYRDIALWNSMSLVFESILSDAYIPNYLRTIETARSLLQKLRPESILLPYETGPYALAFIIAATEFGIRTVGLQHGIIRPNDPDYMIEDQMTKDNFMGHPVPTKLLVFGEYTRRLLTETFSYPPDRIVILGHPLYEDIQDLLPNVSKTSIRRKLHLEPNKKTILVATSMYQRRYGFEDYDITLVRSVIEHFGSMNDIQIVLKPHPREDVVPFEAIIREFKTSSVTISTAPVQQLLLMCDVFITVMTTTILEALALDIPLLIFQPSEEVKLDLLGVIEAGAALSTSPAALKRSVELLLQSKEDRLRLSENSKKFMRDQFAHPSEGVNKKAAALLLGTMV